ncbi:hypothetical protein M9H77_36651 [Catharanthus roseus]|uniref:Uncharacterized protein n=1 Tax=Catharanthus roseus TaxID=4058 RepID=A0ACB9ZSD8_CATRO|nr:hypothetical protein M9H77_36651 [Catharanthus roseus]
MSIKKVIFLILVSLVSSILTTSSASNNNTICPFQQIYQFGDSVSDTGNIAFKAPFTPSSRLPYGETYFRRPTGRCSNGLLMIDFIARALRLPLLEPFLKRGASVSQGVNFAVAGSTALDTSYFLARNISVPVTNSPLRMQLEWFQRHLSSVCHSSSECAKRLRRSLIMMGEIGGNDYNHAFFNGKSVQEVKTYVKDVVGAIVSAIRHVVRLGAVRIVVPGNFPVGCIPIYLTNFANSDPKAYDEMGCLKGMNEFATYHNDHLQKALSALREEVKQDLHDVVILYADYYRAFQAVLRRSAFLGIDQGSVLRACCGTGGAYNFNTRRMCGNIGVPVCQDPSRYLHWDGIHLTQKGYRHMSEVLIPEMLSNMQCF